LIALFIQLAIAAAVLLFVASLPFGSAGRPLRRVGIALLACAFIGHVLGGILPTLLRDWRFYGIWLIASPFAYGVLRARRHALKEQRPTPAKRRDGEQQDQRPSDSEQVF
jgi:hypothetical protein